MADWLDWAAVAEQLGVAALTPLDRLYLLVTITAYHLPIQAVYLDEAQDLDDWAWLMLRQLVAESAVTIVGDPNQRLSGQAPDIAGYFADRRPSLRRLTTSYRATGAITDFFAQFAGDWRAEIQAVQPAGCTPAITDQALAAVLRHLPAVAAQSIGVIAPTAAAAAALANALPVARLLTEGGATTIGPGVNVMALAMAKGLEVDHAVVTAWPAGYASANQRYVATSRGTKTLTLMK